MDRNPRAGLAHARLIAAHHGNAVGLDAVAEKVALLQDTEVQRLLLRNAQTSAPLLQRILSRRRLGDIYNATQSRELPERNRQGAMKGLGSTFLTGTKGVTNTASYLGGAASVLGA